MRLPDAEMLPLTPLADLDGEERDALESILELLKTQREADFSAYRPAALHRRLDRARRLADCDSLARYRLRLATHPDEVAALCDDLLINVTRFFRDTPAWKALAKQVIQPLVASAARGGVVRAWVAGCSTGEEAYSVAMLLAESVAARGEGVDFEVLATDLDETTLETASAAIYPAYQVTDQVAQARVERFFKAIGPGDKPGEARLQVAESLRSRVVIGRHNVAETPPPGRVDMVCCRNLLIFMQRDLQRRVLQRLSDALRAGGTAFFGSAEAAANSHPRFEALDERARLYRRGHAVDDADLEVMARVEASLRAEDRRRRLALLPTEEAASTAGAPTPDPGGAETQTHSESGSTPPPPPAVTRPGPSFVDSALDALDAHVALLDAKGRIAAVNRAWRDFAKVNGLADPDAGIGRMYLQSCRPDGEDRGDVDAVSRGLSSLLSGERDRFDYEYPCHSPVEKRWFHLNARAFEHKGERHVVVAHFNITHRRLREASLSRQAEEARARATRFAQVLDAAPKPMLITDSQARATRVNRACASAWGEHAASLPSPIGRWLPRASDKLEGTIRQCLAEGRSIHGVEIDAGPKLAPTSASHPAALADVIPLDPEGEGSGALVMIDSRPVDTPQESAWAELDRRFTSESLQLMRQGVVTLAAGAAMFAPSTDPTSANGDGTHAAPRGRSDLLRRASSHTDTLLRLWSRWIQTRHGPCEPTAQPLDDLLAQSAADAGMGDGVAIDSSTAMRTRVDEALMRPAFAAMWATFASALASRASRGGDAPSVRVCLEAGDTPRLVIDVPASADVLGVTGPCFEPLRQPVAEPPHFGPGLAELVVRRHGGRVGIETQGPGAHGSRSKVWLAWPGLATVTPDGDGLHRDGAGHEDPAG